ncbi:Guanine nucleotide-binding protein subunit beta 2 [Nakaseomyces bracarensis]|uniref:Guanine nucleotide-binding protein subunit beta 2 n=1 Tax=Nakaseomyces bracarensis TaxID=273131 RepID=A0ABR4NTF7_9SACH
MPGIKGGLSEESSKQGSPAFMVIPGSINPFLKTNSNLANYRQYETLHYGTNYASIFANSMDKEHGERISMENERLLKIYYEYRSAYSNILNNNLNSANNSYTNLSALNVDSNEHHRNASLTSSIETSVLQNERQSIYKVLNEFLVNRATKLNPTLLKEIIDFEESHPKLQSPFQNFFDNYDAADIDENEAETSVFAGKKNPSSYFYSSKPYLLYYKKPLSVKLRDSDIINRHNLWMPIIKKRYQHMIKSQDDLMMLENSTPENRNEVYNSTNYFRNKACPLFIKGLNFVPQNYDTYSGTSIVPSVFSEYKMPALIYHGSVELNKNVYIIGGLSASYRYEEEAPSLKDFYVDGIKNLPAPILSDLINNPSLISNPFVFVYSTLQSRFSRPEFSGSVPPPLICAKGSPLSDRYIFYYGGFEIKTETQIDENGKYYLKKKAFVNNLGYILDTETFKFTKVEVVNVGAASEKNKTFYPRFGHIQVSVCTDVSNSSTSSTDNISLLSSRRSSSHQIHHQNSLPTPMQSVRIPEHAKPPNYRTGSSNVVEKGRKYDSDPKLQTVSSALPYKYVNSVYIFGGYTQTEDDQYQALDDLWRIDIPIQSRGKRGFIKFASQAKLTVIPRGDTWPKARGFAAYTVAEIFPPMRSTLEHNLLTRLKEQYKIDSTTLASKSKTIFGNGLQPRKPEQSTDGMQDSSSNAQSQFSSHVSLSSLSNEARNGAGTPSSAIFNNSISAFQYRKNTLYNSKGLNLVMHGGSNHNEIFGGLWMFDFHNEVWTKNDLFGKEIQNEQGHEEQQDKEEKEEVEEEEESQDDMATRMHFVETFGMSPSKQKLKVEKEHSKKSQCKVVPIDLKLAGHDMAYEGHMMALLGGVTPRDIDIFFHDKAMDDHSFEVRPLLGENTVNIFDMETSILEGYKLKRDKDNNYEYIYEKDRPSQAHSIMTTAGSAIHVNGSIYLVGGLVSLRSELKDIKMRATILQLILPPISLSY